MAETHKLVTKVWIAPGCIVCDSCENDCPEVFDVQEQTCVIRPPALSTDTTGPARHPAPSLPPASGPVARSEWLEALECRFEWRVAQA